MKCFHHNDADGFASAAIVYRAFKKSEKDFIRMNYNKPFPFDIIEKDELVVIVDFSIQEKDGFKKLLDITKHVIWIDHHGTAINNNLDLPETVKGIRRVGSAGCELCWEYFYPNTEAPKSIQLIGAYDVQNLDKFGNDCNKFHAGLWEFDLNPSSKDWDMILNKNFDVDSVIIKGDTVLKVDNNKSKHLLEDWGFETEFEGYKAIACNKGMSSSEMFDDISNEYDIFITFIYDGSFFTVSLYTDSDNIDCSVIAKKYGGGGHPKASGFQIEKLPFTRIKKE